MILVYKGRKFQTSRVDFGINSDGILMMSFDKGVIENPDMGQVTITE